MSPGFSPRRIFTVTGMSTAFTMARTTAAPFSGSASSAAPAPVFMILGTGQPMLMSTMSAPASCTARAASAITSGSPPNTWIPMGCSPGTTSSIWVVRRLP